MSARRILSIGFAFAIAILGLQYSVSISMAGHSNKAEASFSQELCAHRGHGSRSGHEASGQNESCCSGGIDSCTLAVSSGAPQGGESHPHGMDCDICSTCVVHQSPASYPVLASGRRILLQSRSLISGPGEPIADSASDRYHLRRCTSPVSAGSVSLVILNRALLL